MSATPGGVFISYSSRDKHWADAACNVLESNGVRCWIAPRDITPGSEWGAAIIAGIDRCQAMVLVFSQNANQSPQVRREVERAVSKNLIIVPCRIENVLPAGSLEFALFNTHWLDVYNPPLQDQLQRLLQAVQAILEIRSPEPIHIPELILTKAGPSSAGKAPKRSRSFRSAAIVSLLLTCIGCAALGIYSFLPKDHSTINASVASATPSVPEKSKDDGISPPPQPVNVPRNTSAPIPSMRPPGDGGIPKITPPAKFTEPAAGKEVAFPIADGIEMIFCWIQVGTCQLGSPKAERDAVMKNGNFNSEPDWLKSEAEELRGKFTTKGFWLAKYAVTQEEWTAVMGANPSYFCRTGDGKPKVVGMNTDRFPVENVSWNDCQDFLNKLNAKGGVKEAFGKAGKFALPHEDQWEYACRGGKGNQRAFYWGDSLNGDKANCDGNYPFGTTAKGNDLERTAEVGSYKTSASHPWGLCDMSGNVYQWCDNLYSNESKRRVLRGGSWIDSSRSCRSAGRNWFEPVYRSFNIGFRVCFPLD